VTSANGLTADQEFELYLRDRGNWLQYVSDRMVMRLRDTPDAQLSTAWAGLPRDYQRVVWAKLDALQQERIRIARQPTPHTVPNCPMPESPLREPGNPEDLHHG
jgi:hypothetical protein